MVGCEADGENEQQMLMASSSFEAHSMNYSSDTRHSSSTWGTCQPS